MGLLIVIRRMALREKLPFREIARRTGLADLMILRREHGPANVATIVERVSRYTVLFRNNDRRSKPIMNTLINLLAPLPQDARQSLTFDRGLEFVSWRELEKGLGAQAWSAIHRRRGKSPRSRTPAAGSGAGFRGILFCGLYHQMTSSTWRSG